jgi:thiamine biosynthesis lipoprotein
MTLAADAVNPGRFLSLLSALLLVACGDSRLPQLELAGEAMGTTFKVVLVEPPVTAAVERLEAEIVAALQAVDQLASTWRSDSELSVFNSNPSTDWISVSATFCSVLERALDVSRSTDGAFDVTVGPLVNLWGFGPDGIVTQPPSDNAIAAARENVGFEKLATDCNMPAARKSTSSLYVDLSGWAKGYAVDQVAGLLDKSDLENYLVEIGGELRVRGHNSEGLKWSIAVEAPSTSKRVPHAILRVTDTAVATSGDYRNFFSHDGNNYSHTIDVRTGQPVAHDLAAVTVINPSTAYADAMATALLVLGPDAGPALARKLGIAGYFLVRNKTGIREITTPDFDQLSAQ